MINFIGFICEYKCKLCDYNFIGLLMVCAKNQELNRFAIGENCLDKWYEETNKRTKE